MKLLHLTMGLLILSSIQVQAHDAVGGHKSADDQPIDHGQALATSYCQSCHKSEMYTRDNRKINSMESLTTQVGRCEQSLGLQWFEDDIEHTALWLNHAYYHFE